MEGQQLNRKVQLRIASLLRNGKPNDAISYIEHIKSKYINTPDIKFLEFLHKKSLELANKDIISSDAPQFSTTELKYKLSHNLANDFKSLIDQEANHHYQQSEELLDETIVARLLQASSVAEQEKILPYKGKIYLPTDRYSEAEQLVAIRKTAAFLSSFNATVTGSRLRLLRKLIVDNGFSECLIVANGPSLRNTNVAMLQNMFVIGLNSIFLHPYITPHLIVCEDHLVGEDRSQELNNHVQSIKAIPGYLTYCVNPDDFTIVLNHRPRISFPIDIDFSADIDKITYTGGTVTYTALQLAVGLGFQQISLVGVDASYKVENVKEDQSYSTGILESLGDDPNHFNSGYFGKGYRWHDPNPLRMMQAYSVASRYANKSKISITNLTRGGMLDVFKREDFLSKVFECYSKTCIIDWIDINSQAATGEVKKALFKDWPKDKLLHIYSPKPAQIVVYKSSNGDVFLPDNASVLPAWKAIIESNPTNFYWRPTHNRPILNLFAALILLVEKKPYAVHLMDYWTVKVPQSDLRLAYENALENLIKNSAHFFVISQRMKNRLAAKLGLQSHQVTVSHNYSPSTFMPPTAPCDMQQNKRTVFYSGNLDPDQSIDPLLDICGAIYSLNQKSSIQYTFIVRTSEFHIKTNSQRLLDFDFVLLESQSDSYDEYIQQIAKADLCILCYGFGSESRNYLLDSMANKLPDLVTARAKFFAYGDEEIGTLNYLKTIGYPFLESKRDHPSIAKYIEILCSMDYNTYANECQAALSSIKDEFSEMAQCHVFQKQLATCSLPDTSHLNILKAYTSLVDNFQQILKLSKTSLPKGVQEEFQLMFYLSSRQDLADLVYNSVREHGISWSVNSVKTVLEKAMKSSSLDNNLIVQSLAWMIVTQRHSRFADLWDKLFHLIVQDSSAATAPKPGLDESLC